MPKNRIFIADDEEAILSMFYDYLTSKGFEVKTCKDPRLMFEEIKHFQPQIILLDLLMPDLGGFDICEMLNSDRQTQNIPIFIMSGLNDDADIKRAYQLGVEGFFSKPLNLNHILAKINKAISQKEGKE